MKHKFFLPYELVSIWQIIQFGIKIWEPFIIPIAFMIKFTKDTLVTLLLPSIKSLGFQYLADKIFQLKKKHLITMVILQMNTTPQKIKKQLD